MLRVAQNLYDYRELMFTLAWKNVTLRYKQAYLGIAWAIPVLVELDFHLISQQLIPASHAASAQTVP